MPSSLTEWDSLSHFLALFAATGILDGELPQSLLLVGRPGTGKSELVRRFGRWPFAMAVSDVTAEGVRDIVSGNPKLRFLVLDEFQRLFSHTFDAVQNVAGVLISLMSGNASKELVGPSQKGHRVDLTGRQVGVMAAIPSQVLSLRLQDMERTGMLSRFTFLGVQRTDAEAIRIRKNIYLRRLDDLQPYPVPRCMPSHPVKVTTSRACDRELEAWGGAVFARADDRKHRMLTTLVRAAAVLHGRTCATAADVRTLRKFERHLTSLDYDNAALGMHEIPPLKQHPTWYGQ